MNWSRLMLGGSSPFSSCLILPRVRPTSIPSSSFRLALASASTRRSGVIFFCRKYLVSRADVVVLPVPPFPAMAITFVIVCPGCISAQEKAGKGGRPSKKAFLTFLYTPSGRSRHLAVSYTHLTLPTNREV